MVRNLKASCILIQNGGFQESQVVQAGRNLKQAIWKVQASLQDCQGKQVGLQASKLKQQGSKQARMSRQPRLIPSKHGGASSRQV